MISNLFRSDILFTGYYGQLNTGDDAFVEVASWGAKKFWRKEKNIFLAQQKTLPITNIQVKGYPLSIPKTYKIQNEILVSKTNYLISAGGSTIHSTLEPANVKKIAIKYRLRGSGIKIGGIGVSIGPFKSIIDERNTIDYLKKIDFLVLRDQASFDFAKSLDLPYSPIKAFDLAALLPEIYGNSENLENNDKKVVGISICPYESLVDIKNIKKENERNTYVIELIRYLTKDPKIHFKFFIINNHKKLGDKNLILETIKLAKPNSYEIVEYNSETKKIWFQIASCDFIFSTRLHAGIFSCFSDTPFILNEYHKKCSDFLDDIYYNDILRDLNNSHDVLKVGNYILSVLNKDIEYKYPKKVSKMIELSKLNFIGVNIK